MLVIAKKGVSEDTLKTDCVWNNRLIFASNVKRILMNEATMATILLLKNLYQLLSLYQNNPFLGNRGPSKIRSFQSYAVFRCEPKRMCSNRFIGYSRPGTIFFKLE